MSECVECGGSGEICWEPMDWWHGSGVNVQSHECRECDGTGEVAIVDAPTEAPSQEDEAWYMDNVILAQA